MNTQYYTFFNKFQPINNQYIDLLFENTFQKKYSKGEIITRTDEIQKNLLLVEEGVQMSYYNYDGKQHIIAFTYPPSISGIPDSFLFQKPSKFDLQAITNTSVRCLPFQNLQNIFDQYHEIERLFRKMTEFMLAGLIQRHLELHSLNIEERFRVFAQRSPHLFQLVPHKYIANYLNIDPTNFSKLYNKIPI
jgi:CRP-like cAMP-binding protein